MMGGKDEEDYLDDLRKLCIGCARVASPVREFVSSTTLA